MNLKSPNWTGSNRTHFRYVVDLQTEWISGSILTHSTAKHPDDCINIYGFWQLQQRTLNYWHWAKVRPLDGFAEMRCQYVFDTFLLNQLNYTELCRWYLPSLFAQFAFFSLFFLNPFSISFWLSENVITHMQFFLCKAFFFFSQFYFVILLRLFAFVFYCRQKCSHGISGSIFSANTRNVRQSSVMVYLSFLALTFKKYIYISNILNDQLSLSSSKTYELNRYSIFVAHTCTQTNKQIHTKICYSWLKAVDSIRVANL